jgi:hypothetical protein
MTTMSSRRTAVAFTTLGLLAGGGAVVLADMGHPTTSPTHTTAPRTAPAEMRLVSLKVTPDAMKGHNLILRTRNFRFAPQHASGKHVTGEGHAHLYVDGVKTTRLYGPAFYLGDLKPGRHTIRVTLNANDHRDYRRGGKLLAAQATITVPAAAPMKG